MSLSYISASLRRLVEERARGRCEYCRLPSGVAFFAHEVDHVIPEKHGGSTEANNLAWTCWRCNRHKGSDLGSFDPETGDFTFLFHPRNQRWKEHFQIEQEKIVGITPRGRTTVRLLQLNSAQREAERRRLSEPITPDTV